MTTQNTKATKTAKNTAKRAAGTLGAKRPERVSKGYAAAFSVPADDGRSILYHERAHHAFSIFATSDESYKTWGGGN